MKILVVGSGGREHAITYFLKKNPDVEEIFVASGNAGTASIATNIDIKPTDIKGIVAFSKENRIDFVFVAPDDPLVLGAVDALSEAGIACFGPNKRAAAIEGSKSFAKNLMKKYGIPTARFEVFNSYTNAKDYIFSNNNFPVVIKADGLALGKGVTIAQDMEQADSALNSVMNELIFGDSGKSVVIEEFLTGPEVSVLCFTDGKVIKSMVSAMDHKAIYDGNLGPNTGGMGAIAPNRHYTEDMANRCMSEIFIPTMHAMNAEDRTFRGCLYFGLMLTKDGPKVIEYNCRFGDPEAQVVLPLLESDLLSIVQAVAEQRLNEIEVKLSNLSACCVVTASGGYPGIYKTGMPIDFGSALSIPGTYIFHAGTKSVEGTIVSSGGRVLCVTALGETHNEAIEKAYRAVREIKFENIYYRNDIGMF